MKINKIYENKSSYETQFEKDLYEIIRDEIELERTIYNDYEISNESRWKTSNKIIEYLKEKGLNIDMLLSSKKYNL